MASLPARMRIGGHSVAMAGNALVCAWATAAGVAVAFCNCWFWAALPPPNSPPIEQAASSVAAAQAASRRNIRGRGWFMGLSPDATLAFGDFQRHENGGSAAGIHARRIFNE